MRFFPLLKFRVAGQSMNPTYKPGDILLVNKLSYLFNDPKKNDLVVITNEERSILMLKRIAKTRKGKYFAVGDNKNHSTDSRVFGQISRKEIIGKVIAKIN